MIHEIIYNSQRNNIDFGGKFKATWQCFTTCAWMFMSFFNPSINAEDDTELAKYLDDVEDSIGGHGIGEDMKEKVPWIKGDTSYWFLVQQAGIKKWFGKDGIPNNVIFTEGLDFNSLPDILDKSPVILNTAGLGGTRGHIILAIGYDDLNIICHDPFGNAVKMYVEPNGAEVSYPKDWLYKYTGRKCAALYMGDLEGE